MRVRFSTDDVPTRDRQAYWRMLWREVMGERVCTHTLVDVPDPDTFRAQIDAHVAGAFTLAEVQSTADRHLQRTRSDVARDAELRYALIRYPTDTEHITRMTHANRPSARVAAGDLVIGSTEWAFEINGRDPISPKALLIPQEQLKPLLAGGRLTGPVTIPVASPLGALLSTGLATAFEQVPRLSPELGEAALRSLCGLAALACNASADARANAAHAVREVRLAAARRHVEQHLADPALSSASTAAALGISVRQLHLVFEPAGESFGQFVLRRRLEACRATLTDPADAGRSVIDIAYGWGFDSLSTFYRAFRGAFGIAPGELRGDARSGDD
jgi:AraC-like DNA-binding protein